MFKLDELQAALHMPERLAALGQFTALGHVADVAYERIARIIQATLPDSLMLISLIASDKLLVQHQVGLPPPWNAADELPLDWSYCPYVVLSPTAVLRIDTMHAAPVEFTPYITIHGYAASASAPLSTSDGHVVGALTIANHQARPWAEGEIAFLRELAAGLVNELELQLRLSARTQAIEGTAQWQQGKDQTSTNFLLETAQGHSDYIFRVICDTSPVGMFLANADGYFTYTNRHFQTMLGSNQEKILGIHWSSLIHPDERDRVLDQWRVQMQAGQGLTDEYRYLRPDAHIIWVRAHHAALKNNEETVIGHIGTIQDITEQRQTEEMLRTSEFRFRAAVEHFPYTFVIYDEHLRIKVINPYGIVRSGYSEHEILGRTDAELFPTAYTDTYLPLLHQAVATRATKSGQISITFPDATVHALVTYVPVLAGDGAIRNILGITYDITAQQETAELLQRSEERYRLLFESNPHPMWVFDLATLAFLAVNEAAVQHYGYSRDEFLAMTIKDIRPDTDVPSLLQGFDKHQLPRKPYYPARHYKRDGTLIDVEVRARRFDFDGRPAMMVLLTDISERVRADAERQALERKLQETQKLESLGLLAGGIAHDFNNLLAAIMGNAGLALLDLADDSPAFESVAQIELASRRAADLTQQMLAYAGRGHLTMQRLDLNALVLEMTSLLSASISKTAVIEYELAQHLPVVEADKTQLRQVVMNIVINASEAIGDSNGSITLTTGVVQFDKAVPAEVLGMDELQPGQYVYLRVVDTGSGMHHDTITHIFDPFYTTKFVGRGLGLAAVQGIVRRHHGGLLVHSVPKQGTTFTVLLPSSVGSIDKKTLSPETQTSPKQQGIVLVVDDEESVRKLVARVLERAGYTVITANDGQAGIAVFAKQSDSIRCVLLDLTMPVLSGDQVLRTLRKLRPNVQVVLMSGYNEQDITARYSELAPTRFLHKPFTPQQLRELIQQVFDGEADEQHLH